MLKCASFDLNVSVLIDEKITGQGVYNEWCIGIYCPQVNGTKKCSIINGLMGYSIFIKEVLYDRKSKVLLHLNVKRRLVGTVAAKR